MLKIECEEREAMELGGWIYGGYIYPLSCDADMIRQESKVEWLKKWIKTEREAKVVSTGWETYLNAGLGIR